MPTAALVSLATSVPPHIFLQKDVLAATWDSLRDRLPEFERYASIFSNTGIIKRHAVKPFDWYLEPRGWPERTKRFSKAPRRCSSTSRRKRWQVPTSLAAISTPS